MSLPSGLVFFLDFTFTNAKNGEDVGDSVYGGGRVGSQITGGVDLGGEEAEKSAYSLNSGYASPTSSFNQTVSAVSGMASTQISALTETQKKNLRFDPDLLADTASYVAQYSLTLPTAGDNMQVNLNKDNLIGITVSTFTGNTDAQLVRRLTTLSGNTLTITITDSSDADGLTAVTGAYNSRDNYEAASAVGAVVGDDPFNLENNVAIPEIDIQVDSVAVTAVTKKLKAKWSPELAQDLNAYHNLDAEVELTSILSEQVALEIDQEILNDLIQGATAGTLYWSRRPGKFVDRESGLQIGATQSSPDFTGTVSEWYETLAETINDVSARIHRKTLRGGANFVVCSPEVANLLEFTAGFRATVNHEELKGGEIGAVKVGALSKKFDVYVDAYFPRNVVLVGRRGNSFLETGYVYAPYVPLQVTPTIFGIEDFVPRKGVMTRYAKKMVRPDMYGLVICEDLIG
jgi:hypothetical protein